MNKPGKYDLVFLSFFVLLILPFVISDSLLQTYISFNKNHGMITSFVKFAILATAGEMLGLRIKEGVYYKSSFGLIPKMVIWGILGLSIKIAFVVFATGVPELLSYLFNSDVQIHMSKTLSVEKIGIAFCISAVMNIFYAPVLMVTHNITDKHVAFNKGKLKSLTTPIQTLNAIKTIDWDVMWGFVIKKTIPLFWIPAQTITFLLPVDYQVLFAALLSIILGVILALAALKSEK